MSISHAILGILIEGERHGYQIAATLAERISGGPYNSGQIHQALERIEERGWAVSHAEPAEGRSRRPFTITPAGRQEFLAWLRRPVPVTRPVRDEMVVKLVFLGIHDPERLTAFLEGRRREHLRRLAYLSRESQPATDPGASVSLCSLLARDAFRFREEAGLRWVEHCLARMQAMERPAGRGPADEATPELQASVTRAG